MPNKLRRRIGERSKIFNKEIDKNHKKKEPVRIKEYINWNE